VFGDWVEQGTLFGRGFFGLQFLSEEYLDCVIAFNPMLLAKEQGWFQRQLAQPFPDTPQMGVFIIKGFGKPYDFLCLNRFGDQIQDGWELGFHWLFGFVTYGGQSICYANLEYLQEFSTEWIICVAKRWTRGMFKLQARDQYYFVIVKASQT
jgi:hypothetical protein